MSITQLRTSRCCHFLPSQHRCFRLYNRASANQCRNVRKQFVRCSSSVLQQPETKRSQDVQLPQAWTSLYMQACADKCVNIHFFQRLTCLQRRMPDFAGSFKPDATARLDKRAMQSCSDGNLVNRAGTEQCSIGRIFCMKFLQGVLMFTPHCRVL